MSRIAAMPSPESARTHCPKCHAEIQETPGYVSWCEQCRWNLDPRPRRKPRTLYERFYRAMGARLSRTLRDDMARGELERPRFHLGRMLGTAVALLVHAVTLLFVAAGLTLLVAGWPNVMALFWAALCLGIAWLARPQLGKLPEGIVTRADAPALYRLADAAAERLGAPKVHALAIDHEWNASIGVYGWRRQRVMTLGLPLMAALTPQEQLAVIGHEMAHLVNGDPARGLIVGSAIRALNAWHWLLLPDDYWNPDHKLMGLFALPMRMIMRALAALPWLGVYAMVHLFWRDSQRAEYYADALAAKVAGSEAMLAALRKLGHFGTFELVVQRVALQRGALPLLPELRAGVARVPEQELRRLHLVNELELASLDTTHPPTTFRVSLLTQRPSAAPPLRLSAEEQAAIEAELNAAAPRVQRTLIDEYRARLYA